MATTTRSCPSPPRRCNRAQLVKDATLKVYPGAPHGIYGDYQAALDADILDFIAM